jgi:hypothetical protein
LLFRGAIHIDVIKVMMCVFVRILPIPQFNFKLLKFEIFVTIEANILVIGKKVSKKEENQMYV